MTTDKKTQEKPDVKKSKVAHQQVTKQKQVVKSHEKPIAHKAPANNTKVMKQQVDTTQVSKKINVQDLFAMPTVSSQMNSAPQQIQNTKQRAMSNNLPIQQNTPPMHKTRSYTYGTSMQSHQLQMTNTPKTRGASPPTGAYANPAYSDSPSAREVPMPPLNWLFEGSTTTTKTTTTMSKPLTGTDFMRVFTAVAPVN